MLPLECDGLAAAFGLHKTKRARVVLVSLVRPAFRAPTKERRPAGSRVELVFFYQRLAVNADCLQIRVYAAKEAA